MKITVDKITSNALMNRACQFTLNSFKEVEVNELRLFASEHSPIRTRMYWIEMMGIPSFVSTHLVRHKIGVEHFVGTNRDDRGGEEGVDRDTPVNHAMLINAQALIAMARKRLCGKSHLKTRLVMSEIVEGVEDELADCLVPDCIYRGKVCHEFTSCGLCEKGA